MPLHLYLDFNYADFFFFKLIGQLDMQVIQREPWEHIKDEDIKKKALSFCGEIWQVPPMFSAIKVSTIVILELFDFRYFYLILWLDEGQKYAVHYT